MPKSENGAGVKFIEAAGGRREFVESFYHLKGKSMANARCRGLACFAARGLAPREWEEAQAQEPRVYCLGQCYAGPATAETRGRPLMEVHSREAVVMKRMAAGGARTLAEYRRAGGFEGLRKALAGRPEDVVQEVTDSQLRGRGGAGFPTGVKWNFAARNDRPVKYVICNADEGDSGAYIDRFILEDDPFAMMEGLALAGYAIGAAKGYIYLRKEYPEARKTVEGAIEEAREGGFLGEGIAGGAFSFDVEVVSGEGAYVCGEETSLMNSIEGRRPEVRSRPPYPSDAGLFGQPTVVNNVETLANVPWILARGAAAYSALGFSRSRGTKVVSLNSLFARPGLYEVEFGIPLKEIVYGLGGGLKTGKLKAVMVGGPLAGLIPPERLDLPLGFEELQAAGLIVGHGGIIAFDERTSIAEIAHEVFEFGAYESCGKCFPCRLGSREIERMFARILERGPADGDALERFNQIVQAMRNMSQCGHGMGMGDFAASLGNSFKEELSRCFA